jgi:hypothetical protein
MESLLVPLHLTLNTYHSPSTLQPTGAHMLFYVTCEQLILKSRNGLLEQLALVFQAAVAVDLCNQRSVANLTECLIHAIMPHVVSV